MTDQPKPSLEAVLDYCGSHHHPGMADQMVACPLHEDSTPSASVNLQKQVWHCHSCGKGGDAYTLLELKEGLDFVGAREFVAAHGLATADADGGDRPVRDSWARTRSGVSGKARYRPRFGS